LRANRFLLCMSSPTLHKMICGPFKEGMTTRLELDDVNSMDYSNVLDMWCGKEGLRDKSLDDAMAMASVADRLEMMEVGTTLEDAIIAHLSVHVCGDVLMGSVRLGLRRVEAAARGLVLERFEEVAGTEGFMRMDKGAVGSLLDDDMLSVSREEAALEAVVAWMKKGRGDPGELRLRGRGLLSKIRFCVMDPEYLAVDVQHLFPADHADWVNGHVLEALKAKAAGRRRELVGVRLLGEKAGVRRPRPGVRWELRSVDDRRSLAGHADAVCALAECEGRMCSGSLDGTIRVWGGASLKRQRTLHDRVAAGEDDGVCSLAAWEGRLVSGHLDSVIRVWNVATGVREWALAGHSGAVRCLAVSETRTRLVSGSDDMSIKVWVLGAGKSWRCQCKRTLVGHRGPVFALATWQDKVLSGSVDKDVLVWDMGTGAHAATLSGHGDAVCGLAVHGDRLFSASDDGTIREWALGTWARLRTVEAYGPRMPQAPLCLVVSGSKLISGSGAGQGPSAPHGDDDSEEEHWEQSQQYEVRVWDLRTLECEHTRRQPGGSGVWCLAAGCGVVWGGVGEDVVVWGQGRNSK
jgi:hypothetical protein